MRLDGLQAVRMPLVRVSASIAATHACLLHPEPPAHTTYCRKRARNPQRPKPKPGVDQLTATTTDAEPETAAIGGVLAQNEDGQALVQGGAVIGMHGLGEGSVIMEEEH